MIIDIIISIIFLLLFGLTIMNGRYAKAGIGEKPLMYTSVYVQFFLNVSFLVFIGLSLFLIFFYSWKLFLILMLVGFITESLVIVPIIERGLSLIINKIIKTEKNISKTPSLKEEWEEFKNQKIDILAINRKSIIEMIDQFMIPDNINVTNFAANYMILRNGSREIYSASSKLNNEPDLSNEGTFSIDFFSPIDRPLGYPLWFIAGYPDVVKWFSELDEEKIISIVGNLTQDSADEEGHLKLPVLRKMIDAYKLTNKLECSY